MRLLTSIGLLLFGSVAIAQIQLHNDEFSDAGSLVNWLNINDVEGWNITQLQNYNIGDTTAGELFMMPLSASWFEEYRGALLFKEIAGDFVVTTQVTVSARDGMSVPSTDFSLAGIMIRTPMDYPNQDPSIDWMADEQNYIFMSIGRATGNQYSFEIKNTCDSRSCLKIESADSTTVLIRMVRRGDQIVVMSRFGNDPWTIQNRYNRGGLMPGVRPQTFGSCSGNCNSPLPDTVQLGFVTYTDWPKVSSLVTSFHNSNTIHPDSLGVDDPTPGTAFNPDLRASFNFIRFDSLNLPDEWIDNNYDISNPGDISDNDFIAEFGYDTEDHCPEYHDVISLPISDSYIQVTADSLVNCAINMDSVSSVIFSSGQEILLSNGFELINGTSFTAQITDCPD